MNKKLNSELHLIFNNAGSLEDDRVQEVIIDLDAGPPDLEIELQVT